MSTFWYFALLLGFGAVNFGLGLFAAALLGFGPLHGCRAARFVADPVVSPPAFLITLVWRVRRAQKDEQTALP